MKKELLKALARAKELEKLPDPSREEIVSIYKDALEQAEKLNKLLEPQWFIRDEDTKKKPVNSVKKSTTKKNVPKKKMHE